MSRINQADRVAELTALLPKVRASKAKAARKVVLDNIANVIATAPWGSRQQHELMWLTEKGGLFPSYYAGSIRVQEKA